MKDMDENLKLQLTEAGVDVDSVMERFMGNAGMLERFLRKFLNDMSYQKLLTSIEEKNVEDAFAAAHTLKGVCGNLSINTLRDIVSRQTECFRAGNLEEGVAIMPEVTAEYERVTAAIRSCYP